MENKTRIRRHESRMTRASSDSDLIEATNSSATKQSIIDMVINSANSSPNPAIVRPSLVSFRVIGQKGALTRRKPYELRLHLELGTLEVLSLSQSHRSRSMVFQGVPNLSPTLDPTPTPVDFGLFAQPRLNDRLHYELPSPKLSSLP